jgi:hypothetical protein
MYSNWTSGADCSNPAVSAGSHVRLGKGTPGHVPLAGPGGRAGLSDDQMNKRMTKSRILAWDQTRKKPDFGANSIIRHGQLPAPRKGSLKK